MRDSSDSHVGRVSASALRGSRHQDQVDGGPSEGGQGNLR